MGNSLFTLNISTGQSLLIVGDTYIGNMGYREGQRDGAWFNVITSFVQMSSTLVLVADHVNSVIRAVDRITENTSLVAGSPANVGERDGNFSFSLLRNPRKMDASDNISLYVTQDGAGKLALLDFTTVKGYVIHIPISITTTRGIALQPSTNFVFVAGDTKMVKYKLATNTVTNVTYMTYSGDADGPLADASFSEISDMMFLNFDTILAVDSNNHRLRVIDLNGNVTSICSPHTSADKGNIRNCSVPYPISVGYFNATTILIGTDGAIRALSSKISEIIDTMFTSQAKLQF